MRHCVFVTAKKKKCVIDGSSGVGENINVFSMTSAHFNVTGYFGVTVKAQKGDYLTRVSLETS